jgi:hypothetical protein
MIEIAGFKFKNYAAYSAITLSTDAQSVRIHHNTFALTWTGATNAASIAGTGAGGAWGDCVRNNWFVSYAGTSATCAAIVDIAANATCARVRNNEFTIGDTNTASICINNLAVKGRTDFNTFSAAYAQGGSGSGVITKAIAIGAGGAAIGNQGAVTTQLLVSGGTVDRSFVGNYAGLNGGTVQDNDT